MMNNKPVKPKIQQRTTTIVLSSHKTNIASPTLDGTPPPVKAHKKKEKGKEGKGKKQRSNGGSKRKELHRLPKPVLCLVCAYLTFEEMFTCASVCKKMARRVYRMLTSTKQCSAVEKADIKLLTDPTTFEDGLNVYRILDAESGGCQIPMSALRTIPTKGKERSGMVSNSIRHFEVGHVAYHLKQLEHMVLYSTVNGNEIARVANDWIFFNRSVFVKITDDIVPNDDAISKENNEQLYLVDMILVEANLTTKLKTSLFNWTSPAFVEPFCEVSLGRLHLRTSIASFDDPIWNEDCSFIFNAKTNNNLQITLYDYGKLGRHTNLGNVEIPLKNLACDVLHDVWHPVQAQDNEISGKFHILVHKSPISHEKTDTHNLGILGYCGPICDSIPMRLEFGDIILISNSEFYTHIAKLGTMSLWDHIAMVVERKHELHLFESTPDGVFTTPLNRRLQFYLKSSTLGVRRLTLTRTAEMKKALRHFIREVDGRPYKQNWLDLVRAWQGSHTSEDLSSIFCSELIAAAFKRMGLFSNEISSNNFLPVDFALPNNPKVKLLQGKLDKIRMIYSSAS